MTILVDEPKQYPTGRWSHMMSNVQGEKGLEELHLMAIKLGLNREMFQGQNERFPHYDLTVSKYAKAMLLGARLTTTRDMVKMVRTWEADEAAT